MSYRKEFAGNSNFHNNIYNFGNICRVTLNFSLIFGLRTMEYVVHINFTEVYRSLTTYKICALRGVLKLIEVHYACNINV